MCQNVHKIVCDNTTFSLLHLLSYVLLFILRRITDAGMIDGLQFLNEDGLGILDVAEGDRTLAEISISHL